MKLLFFMQNNMKEHKKIPPDTTHLELTEIWAEEEVYYFD